MTTLDGLAGRANSGAITRELNIMENKACPIVEKPGNRKVNVTWNAKLYIYPTGASLQDKSGWDVHGQVHVVLVHSGSIKQPDPFWPQYYTLTAEIRNTGARAVSQPVSKIATENQANHEIDWSIKDLTVFEGHDPKSFSPAYRQTFSHPKKCEQQGSVSGQEAVTTILLNSDNESAQDAKIYGLSHFTLQKGDYKDVYFDFRFTVCNSGAGGAGTGLGKWENVTHYKADQSTWGTKLAEAEHFPSTSWSPTNKPLPASIST